MLCSLLCILEKCRTLWGERDQPMHSGIELISVGLTHARPQLLSVSDRNTRERISDESVHSKKRLLS